MSTYPLCDNSAPSSSPGQSSNIDLLAPKFIRRPDLTPLTRLYIAFTTLWAKGGTGRRGRITELARQFLICRAFAYMLARSLEETTSIVFGNSTSLPATGHEKQLPYYFMLSLRLEGRCSIQAISTIMKRFGIANASTGSISEFLHHAGSLLPDTLKTKPDEVQLVVFLSDEIFSKRIPILVTVDPISSAILKMELADARKADNWKDHWECLEENGYFAVYLVTDEGSGLCTAQKEALADIIRQPDTYHAIAHQLGAWVNRLELAAYKAIENEYDRYDKLDSAKSDKVIDKRIEEYEKAAQSASEKIEIYDTFKYLYTCIINELRLFDAQGNLRERKEAEANIHAALALLDTLGHAKISEALAKVRRTMPELLNYFDVAKQTVGTLKGLPIAQEALQALCLAWQWNKNSIKAKKAGGRQHCVAHEQDCLEFATGYLQDDYHDVKEQVYDRLDRIVQSSALVECINSIIRPYLNTSKNHVTQEALNLIMFYHNHRRYVDGKRKRQTPIEILTGKKQDKDWIELLLNTLENEDPAFFASSR